jgi:type I restriction enzyme S subunit
MTIRELSILGRYGHTPAAVSPRLRVCVAKLDRQMALCDRLQSSLTSSDDTRRRVLEALLAEALAPAEERELEAAE